ncbi:TPA: hypothetical protein N0H21_001331 [Pseudomonas aeruginosa]|nr:hypothetical protein [Pseudomonas aeruginosa]
MNELKSSVFDSFDDVSIEKPVEIELSPAVSAFELSGSKKETTHCNLSKRLSKIIEEIAKTDEEYMWKGKPNTAKILHLLASLGGALLLDEDEATKRIKEKLINRYKIYK